MAKTQRINLSSTTKAMADMSKTLNQMAQTLDKISATMSGITTKVTNQAQKAIKSTKVSLDELYDSIDKKNTSFSDKVTRTKVVQTIFGSLGIGSKVGIDIGHYIGVANKYRKERISNIDSAYLNYYNERDVLLKSFEKGEIDKDQYSIGKAKAAEELSSAFSANSIKAMIGTITGTIALEFIKVAIAIGKKAFEVIDETAKYAVSTSYIVSSSARDQMLKYGLSESQNYAFTQTKSIMGIQTDEDLYWMNSNQRAMFTELMQKETEIYEKMTSNGTLESFQKMQIDVALLKQEFYANVVKFISENKDTILNLMNTGVQLLSQIMNLVSTIASLNKYNPMNWLNNLLSNSGSKTITLNTYVNEASNAEDTANKVTDSTLSVLATYANS